MIDCFRGFHFRIDSFEWRISRRQRKPLILREVNGRVCNCATYRIEKPVEILILISVPSYCHVNELTPYLSSFSRIGPLLSILN